MHSSILVRVTDTTAFVICTNKISSHRCLRLAEHAIRATHLSLKPPRKHSPRCTIAAWPQQKKRSLTPSPLPEAAGPPVALAGVALTGTSSQRHVIVEK